MVEVLTNQLKRRLCTISFFLGHVEVIDENYAFFTNRRTIIAFSSLLHFAVDGVLGLIRSSLSRKRKRNVLICVIEAS